MDEIQFITEYRNDFKIRPMVKRFWAASLEVLRQIDIICRRHRIRWYADSGTMLGAVRDAGFIPWDDDIDISMSRMDYECFIRYAQKELPAGYCIVNKDKDRCGLICSVLNSKEPFCLEQNFLDRFFGCPYPAGVDLFVYDNIPEDADERETFKEMFSYAFLAGEQIPNNTEYSECIGEIREWIDKSEKMTGIEINKYSRTLKQDMLKMADMIAAMYYDTETRYVAKMWGYAGNEKLLFERKWFDEIVYFRFENVEMPVPIGYKHMLEAWYGDYMIPIRMGAMHDYPCFKQYEEEMFCWYCEKGRTVPEFFKE